MPCPQELREQFRLAKIKPSGESACHCAESQFFPWPLVFVYRFAFAAYCAGWLIYSGFHYANGKTKWFIYLTNWGYLIETVYFIYASVITLWYNLREKKRARVDIEMKTNANNGEVPEIHRDPAMEYPMMWHHKIMWGMFNTALSVAFTVTIIYWGFSFVDETSALDISNHAVNSAFMLAELMLSSILFRLLHIIYPFCFLILYLIFTVVYWAAGGTNAVGKPYIYSYVDYSKNPGLAVGIVLGGAFILLPLLQLLFFGLYELRCYWARTCCKQSTSY